MDRQRILSTALSFGARGSLRSERGSIGRRSPVEGSVILRMRAGSHGRRTTRHGDVCREGC